MNQTVSAIFEQKPVQWGLRGDPYLWEDLQSAFASIPLPCPVSQFVEQFNILFIELTNQTLNSENEHVYIEKYAHGGMSSGHISLTFWKERALPLLIGRLQKENETNPNNNID